MDRGYTRLYRKFWDNELLMERGHVFSRREAWLYLVNVQARGVDGPGLKRGEFQASIRYLAGVWNWGKGKVERFMSDLEHAPEPMIMRVGQQTGQQTGQFEGHFIICNYDTYNPRQDSKQDTSRDSKRDKYKEGIKEGLKKEETKDSCSPPVNGSASPAKLLEIYQQNNQSLPKVMKLSHDREARCRARINQAVRDGCLSQYLEDFARAVRQAQLTPFLRGEGPTGWKASFEWFIANDSNVYKVLEGKYANSSPKQESIWEKIEKEREANGK